MEGMEATFILKDVIYIVVGVGSALGFYWKMVISDKSQEDKIRQMKKDIEKNESVMFKKFSGVHTKMEKNEDKYNSEFKVLNKEITDLKLAIGVVDGKLDILINK